MVEAQFGQAGVGSAKLEFLSNNGGAYRAHESHALARAMEIEHVHMPVCSPKSNGMAESFVNTFKRDYVSSMDRSNAESFSPNCQTLLRISMRSIRTCC